MAKVHDLINQLREPGEDGVPDTIYDDIAGEYDHLESTSAANVDSLTASNAEANAEITRLKAANHDLYLQIPKAGDDEPGGDDESQSDGEPLSLDSLFQDA